MDFVLQSPSYSSDLNPSEFIWATLKVLDGSNNTAFTSDDATVLAKETLIGVNTRSDIKV